MISNCIFLLPQGPYFFSPAKKSMPKMPPPKMKILKFLAQVGGKRLACGSDTSFPQYTIKNLTACLYVRYAKETYNYFITKGLRPQLSLTEFLNIFSFGAGSFYRFVLFYTIGLFRLLANVPLCFFMQLGYSAY